MAIELIQKEQKPTEPKTYKSGDTFKRDQNGFARHFILASVGAKSVLLVSLLDGRRNGEPILVDNSYKITQKEFDMITYHKASEFIQKNYTLTEI